MQTIFSNKKNKSVKLPFVSKNSKHLAGTGAENLLALIEGFGRKRALGILRKIELCQKRFKFCMQFCLGVLNNVLHVFFPEACFLFEIVRKLCEKTHFPEGILWGPFVE